MPKVSGHPLAARLFLLLRQGLTPERLALSIALGAGLGCFPVFGTTTILCTLIALSFRLNLPAIQVGNYLALPVQLLLFFPFLRLGERILHAPRMPLSAEQLIAMASSSPDRTARILLDGQWHAILGWLVVAPGITLIVALALRPLMRLALARANKNSDAITIPRQV
jgi:uncharacterized protein (DUF2062 family)